MLGESHFCVTLPTVCPFRMSPMLSQGELSVQRATGPFSVVERPRSTLSTRSYDQDHVPSEQSWVEQYPSSFPTSNSTLTSDQLTPRRWSDGIPPTTYTGSASTTLQGEAWKRTEVNEVAQHNPLNISNPSRSENAEGLGITRQSTTESVEDEPADGSSMRSSDTSISTSVTSHNTSCLLSSKPDTEPNQPTTASDIISRGEDQPRDDPFSNPAQIPGIAPPTYVYPHSASVISEAFRDRYCEIINLFRQNTEEHPRLRDYVQQIDYTLKMCGPSADQSHPSILVFCRPSEFSSLQSLLNSKHLKLQYCVRQSTAKYFWKNWRGKAAPTASENSHKPLFRLYFWRQARPRTLLKFEEAKVFLGTQGPLLSNSSSGSHSTMCGTGISTIIGGRRTSTLGCTLQVGYELFGLTAAHAVKNVVTPDEDMMEDDGIRLVGSILAAEDKRSEDEISEDDDFFDDDVQYLDLPDGPDPYASGPDTYPTTPMSEYDGKEDEPEYTVETTALFPHVDPQKHDSADSPDLDWALVRLTDPDCWLPNATTLAEDPDKTVYISDIATTCPLQETKVLVVNSTGHPVPAKLQPIPAFLGGINSDRQSTVWSIIPSHPNAITFGDSGSLVIDATSFAAYGFVIGINALAEVYISPLSAVLEQIQSHVPGYQVSLPNSLSFLQHEAALRENTPSSPPPPYMTHQPRSIPQRQGILGKEDDVYLYLWSTPYTHTAPRFRHGPIIVPKPMRLKASSDLDWTAFQSAMLGMEKLSFGNDDDENEENAEISCEIAAWFDTFGFSGYGELVPERLQSTSFVRDNHDVMTASSRYTAPSIFSATDSSVSSTYSLPTFVDRTSKAPDELQFGWRKADDDVDEYQNHDDELAMMTVTVNPSDVVIATGSWWEDPYRLQH